MFFLKFLKRKMVFPKILKEKNNCRCHWGIAVQGLGPLCIIGHNAGGVVAGFSIYRVGVGTASTERVYGRSMKWQIAE